MTPDHYILEQVIDNSYDGIMVTDEKGEILLANYAAVVPMQKTIQEIIGKNVQELVKEGVNDRSTTMEAIRTRTQVTGLVNTISGKKVMSTSIPLLNKNGEIAMVITNTRSKDLVDTFIEALEEERKNVAHYKSVIHYLDDSLNQAPIAESPKMKNIISAADVVAKTDTTVLLLGESGTGKEVIARYIHQRSKRHMEPFITVNCAAIPQELAESEFFGYDKGAFSGASTQGKIGFFQMANKGTLFLDEIAELPLAMQSKLLRVLENKEFRRVGGTTLIKTNVRLLAATNKNLKDLVDKKLFREDLYYRLNVIPLTIPPLRERPEDIAALSRHFLNDFNKKYGFNKTFTPKTIRKLKSYNWPGNIRELRNIIERLVITSYGKEELDLKFELENPSEKSGKTENLEYLKPAASGNLKEIMNSIEEKYIRQVLRECDGRMSEAAERLGIHRTLLYKKLKKYKCL